MTLHPSLQHRLPILGLAAVLLASSCRSSAPPERGIDLLDHFRLAAVQESTRNIDFGTAEAHPFLGTGWSHDIRRGRHSYAWGLFERSTLRIFTLESRPITLRFRCWPYLNDRDSQVLTVTFNDVTLDPLKLSPEPAEYHLEVPAPHVISGWNDLVLAYSPPHLRSDRPDDRKSVVAWDWLRIDSPGASETAPFVRPDPAPAGLVLPFGNRVDYFLKLPPDSRLVIDGLRPWGRAPRQEATDSALQIELQDALSSEVQRFELAPSGDASGLQLPISSARIARVSLQAVRGAAPSDGVDGLEVLQPVLRSKSPPAPTRPRHRHPTADPQTNVLIYLVDTLRADHLGCYGYDKPTSPRVDAFARDATLFRHALAQSSWTRPAVASLFTGLYARSHGTNERKSKLPASIAGHSLQAILRANGYETAAFITNGNVSEGFGFDVGFDVFERLPEQKTDEVHYYSDEVNEAVFAWLDHRSSASPFHLYVHTTDPHAPYVPRSPYRERFAPGVPRTVGLMESRLALRRGKIRNPEAKRDDLMALYDAEVAFNDHHFGALLDKLKALGSYDSTLIVFLADHGEEFFDHQGWGHGATLFAEQLHIPLLIKFPQGFAGNRTVDQVARQIDVMPTILDYLGYEIPRGTQGRSLLPCLDDPVNCKEPSETFACLTLDGRRLDSVTAAGHKLIQNIAKSRRPEGFDLYDLHADPLERTDLEDERPVIAGYLKSKLLDPAKRPSAPAEEEATIDPATDERLRALGY